MQPHSVPKRTICRRDCIQIQPSMRLVLSGVMGPLLLAGCLTTSDAAPAMPSDLACAGDDFEFNLRNVSPADLKLDFDGSDIGMRFEERTAASLPTGPVSLTTYVPTDGTTPISLTLSNDGFDIRARIQRPNERDIGAMCHESGE